MPKKFELDADELLSAAAAEIYVAMKTANFEPHVTNAAKCMKLLQHRIERFKNREFYCDKCGARKDRDTCIRCDGLSDTEFEILLDHEKVRL